MNKVSMIGFTIGFFLVSGMDAQNLEQSTKITLEARAESDQFGSAICIEDNQLFVGATGEKEDENGENPLEKAGAVFVFEKQEGNWINTQKLVADEREEGDRFGYDIDASSNFLIVGADKHAKDETGTNSKTSAGAVYVFKQTSPGTWEKVQKLVASDRAESDRFGASVAIDGDYLVVGAPSKNNSQGAVYVFEKNTKDVWEEKSILTSMKSFYPTYGRDVDISGTRVIVGSPSQIYSSTDPVYHYNFSGMAFIYERDSEGTWHEVFKASSSDVAESDHFATSVAISGDYALVGTPDKKTDEEGNNSLAAAGAVYVLHRESTGKWVEKQKIVPEDRAENDQFGSSVSLSENMGVIGSWWDDHDENDENTINKSGSAYILKKGEDNTWSIVQKIAADDRSLNASFGNKVFNDNQTVIVGVGFEDYDSQGTDSLDNAGAVYIFEASTQASLINTETNKENFEAYPNPTNNVLTIQTENTSTIILYNLQGKIMKQQNINQIQTTMDISDLQPGLYILKTIETNGTISKEKILKN